MGYDFIGDIHGCAKQLESLLLALGYARKGDTYSHAERRAVFLGDFIDRCPEQRRTLDIVRPMIEAGALAVMGNHEFNAVCYAEQVSDGFLRPHCSKNTNQHAAFLAEFPFGSDAHREAVDWFRTLPVYLDEPGFGVVHACWSADAFAILAPDLSAERRITDRLLLRCRDKTSATYRAVECVLKGPEEPLPPALSFLDKDGHPRDHARLRWWTSADLPPSQRLEFGGATLSQDQLTELDREVTPTEHAVPDKPVFVGHYWLRSAPAPLSARVACVDYSVAKGGKLAAYRWDGETTLLAEKFVAV